MEDRCISACWEKDKLGIRQGWCWTCVNELRGRWREELVALEVQIVRVEAQRDVLLAELQNIANANPATWELEVRDQFKPWAQNRARASICAAFPDKDGGRKYGLAENAKAECR